MPPRRSGGAESGGATAAGFEFFPAATWTGIVAADFGELAFEGEFELGARRVVWGLLDVISFAAGLWIEEEFRAG